jgi:hypothetical protein
MYKAMLGVRLDSWSGMCFYNQSEQTSSVLGVDGMVVDLGHTGCEGSYECRE